MGIVVQKSFQGQIRCGVQDSSEWVVSDNCGSTHDQSSRDMGGAIVFWAPHIYVAQ